MCSQLSHLCCLALAKAVLLQEQVSSLCFLPDVVELDDFLHRPSGDLGVWEGCVTSPHTTTYSVNPPHPSLLDSIEVLPMVSQAYSSRQDMMGE